MRERERENTYAHTYVQYVKRPVGRYWFPPPPTRPTDRHILSPVLKLSGRLVTAHTRARTLFAARAVMSPRLWFRSALRPFVDDVTSSRASVHVGSRRHGRIFDARVRAAREPVGEVLRGKKILRATGDNNRAFTRFPMKKVSTAVLYAAPSAAQRRIYWGGPFCFLIFFFYLLVHYNYTLFKT